MIPRLTLDITWSDLTFALAGRPDPGAEARILARVPAGRSGAVCLSVRTALDALLGELALPAGAEVLMSAVNIQNMADIVRAHGLTVVPVDITLEGLAPTPAALEAAVTPQSRLFLLAHLFGSRVETEGLAKVCARHGLLFVEDCAQAYDGSLEASPGTDVSLYSFGPIKTATALGGAVALFADDDQAARVRTRTAAYPPMPQGWWRRRVVKHVGLKVLSSPRVMGWVVGLLERLGHDVDAVIGKAARGFAAGELLPQIRRRPPEMLVSLLDRRLADPPLARLASRRARAERIVQDLPAGAVPGIGLARHAWWLVPVLSRDPAATIAHGRQQGLDLTRGATSLRALTPAPNAEALIDQVVYLPIPEAQSPEQLWPAFDRFIARAGWVPRISEVLEPTA
jgi:perosamine synthetase